jgi:hypothetical protein
MNYSYLTNENININNTNENININKINKINKSRRKCIIEPMADTDLSSLMADAESKRTSAASALAELNRLIGLKNSAESEWKRLEGLASSAKTAADNAAADLADKTGAAAAANKALSEAQGYLQSLKSQFGL